jgi:hypothetical protein
MRAAVSLLRRRPGHTCDVFDKNFGSSLRSWKLEVLCKTWTGFAWLCCMPQARTAGCGPVALSPCLPQPCILLLNTPLQKAAHNQSENTGRPIKLSWGLGRWRTVQLSKSSADCFASWPNLCEASACSLFAPSASRRRFAYVLVVSKPSCLRGASIRPDWLAWARMHLVPPFKSKLLSTPRCRGTSLRVNTTVNFIHTTIVLGQCHTGDDRRTRL